MIRKLVAGAALATIVGTTLFAHSVRRRAEASVPPDGQFIDLGGNRIHYVDRGPRDAPAIVLIHGLAGQMRNFGRPLLDELETDYRLILVDRPGSGWSVRAPGASSSLSQQAGVVAELIRTLGVEKPMIVGHSLGGALALTMAAEQPDVVGRLALICPLTQDQKDVPKAFKALEIRSPVVRRLVAHSIAVPMGVIYQDRILAQVFGPEPVPEDFAVTGGGALGARPVAFYENSSDMVALEDHMPSLVQRYGSITVPVRILFAESDQLLDPQFHGAAAAAQLGDARLELVPGGHMLPFTQPEMTARWIRRAAEEAKETGHAPGQAGG
jgi:pimeloyl-ACP methyl ester carboxylesterase